MSYRGYGTPFWLKLIFFLVSTGICLFIASIPEATMYFLWHLVAPTEGWQRLVLVAMFFLGGGGLTILFWVGAAAMWVAAVTSIADA
jgi:hypothetical protein